MTRGELAESQAWRERFLAELTRDPAEVYESIQIAQATERVRQFLAVKLWERSG